VTGAARRLGRAVALRAAREGWNPVIHHLHSHEEAQQVVAEARTAGAEAAAVRFDLAAEDADKLIAAGGAAAGAPLSALVNCAAIFEWDDAASFSAQAFRKHMETNALAPTALSLAFARALPDEARGAIVNFLDFKLASPYPDHFSYTLSKYALAGATEMLARALAPRVRVNAVAPGYVLAAPGQAAKDHERLHAQNPLAYGVTAGDVAGAALFLLGNPAITGQTVFVDAGLRFQSHERDFAFR
jgi:NAD(P)-dependent dehydrogenase (short-subunit alcohol dehydrogenase family)